MRNSTCIIIIFNFKFRILIKKKWMLMKNCGLIYQKESMNKEILMIISLRMKMN